MSLEPPAQGGSSEGSSQEGQGTKPVAFYSTTSDTASVQSTLHPYQLDAVADIERVVAAGQRRILLVAPTGAGKTIVFSALVARYVERHDRRAEASANAARLRPDVAGLIECSQCSALRLGGQ